MIQKSEIGSQKPERRSALNSGLRILVSALVVTTTSACGFHPLYGDIGDKPGATSKFGFVYVPPIQLETVGYELRNDLLDDMQAAVDPQNALYELKVNLREKNDAIAIQNTQVGALKEVEITRYNYTLICNYQLVDRKTLKVLTKGTESSLSGYDVVESPYATQVAKESAQTHTAADISQHLRLRLAVYFSGAISGAK